MRVCACVCVRRKKNPAAISSHPVSLKRKKKKKKKTKQREKKKKNTPRIMKYSHIRCPSGCQTRTLDEFLRNSSQNTRGTQARPLSRSVSALLCFIYCYLLLEDRKRRSATERSPGILSAVKMCAHLVMRGAFRQLPLTDRHIQLPFRPLLYSTPPTSVTLTVKAHLSIRCSNCSLGWLSFQRRPGCPAPPPRPPSPATHPTLPAHIRETNPSVLCVNTRAAGLETCVRARE